MKKKNVVHIRLSDNQYDAVKLKAKSENMPVSEYLRNVLEASLNTSSDPFKSYEFHHVIQWIWSVRGKMQEAYVFDALHYNQIIRKHYHNLEPELQELLDNVLKELEQIINAYKLGKIIGETYQHVYLFGLEKEETYFDYDKFENLIINRHMF